MVFHDNEGNLEMPRQPRRRARICRRGAVTVLSALFLIMIMLMAALAIDLGMLFVAKTELQRSADAAALAAADALLQQKMQAASNVSAGDISHAVEEVAMAYASMNAIGRTAP